MQDELNRTLDLRQLSAHSARLPAGIFPKVNPALPRQQGNTVRISVLGIQLERMGPTPVSAQQKG